MQLTTNTSRITRRVLVSFRPSSEHPPPLPLVPPFDTETFWIFHLENWIANCHYKWGGGGYFIVANRRKLNKSHQLEERGNSNKNNSGGGAGAERLSGLGPAVLWPLGCRPQRQSSGSGRHQASGTGRRSPTRWGGGAAGLKRLVADFH